MVLKIVFEFAEGRELAGCHRVACLIGCTNKCKGKWIVNAIVVFCIISQNNLSPHHQLESSSYQIVGQILTKRGNPIKAN